MFGRSADRTARATRLLVPRRGGAIEETFTKRRTTGELRLMVID